VNSPVQGKTDQLFSHMAKIKVLLADDHTIVREGFRSMISLEKDIEVVGEAQNGRVAIGLFKSLQPDVVLMDIAMPLLNGLEAARQIFKEFPKAKIIMLSAHSDDAYVTNATDSGAVGFLIKQTSACDVCKAIRAVFSGKTSISPSIIRHFNRRNPIHNPKTQLTMREMEILQMIAEGKANKEIASELGISIKTVEKHREHLMRKLDIHDTAGLTRYAISTGIIESSVQLTILTEQDPQ
jgi:DNA-binding NarL/FixJ family response regulator